MEYCRSNKLPLILGCDANAHHTEWGSTDCNARGKSLLEFIISNNLSIDNVGCEPTFITSIRSEVLDITLCNEPLSGLISQWRVSKEPSMSDHRIIRFALKVEVRDLLPVRIPRNSKWDVFRETLELNISRVRQVESDATPRGLESRLAATNQFIIDAYHCGCPLKKTTKRQGCPWWTSKVSVLRKSVRRLFNKAKRTGNWEDYRQHLTTYNKEIRSAKTSSFRKFCVNVSSTPEAGRLHKALAKGKTALRLLPE